MAQKLTFASGCKYIAYQQAAFFVCDCKNAYLLCHVSPLNLEDQILLQIWQLIKKIMYAFMEFISCDLSNIVLFVWVLSIIFVASYWLLLTLTHVHVILLIYLTGASSRPVKNFLIHLAATICAGVTAGSLAQGLPAMNKIEHDQFWTFKDQCTKAFLLLNLIFVTMEEAKELWHSHLTVCFR